MDPPRSQSGSRKPEPEFDVLSNIVRQFNDMFGNIAWGDADRVTKLIIEDLPKKVSENSAYQNAMKNSDRQNARIEHDKARRRWWCDCPTRTGRRSTGRRPRARSWTIGKDRGEPRSSAGPEAERAFGPAEDEYPGWRRVTWEKAPASHASRVLHYTGATRHHPLMTRIEGPRLVGAAAGLVRAVAVLESRHASIQDERGQGARFSSRVEITHQPCTGCGGLRDSTGCARLDPGDRGWHRYKDQGGGWNSLSGRAGDRRLWGLPSSRCCVPHIEERPCQLYVKDCALGLARQGGAGRSCDRGRFSRSRRGTPDHFPKRCSSRGAGMHTFLGWSLASHLREVSR